MSISDSKLSQPLMAALGMLLSAALAGACGAERSMEAPQPDWRSIYSAILSDSASLDLRAGAALVRTFLSNDGGVAGQDPVPDSVATFLLREGLVTELCAPTATDASACRTKTAATAIYLSRVVPLSPDTVRVFVVASRIRPANDTSSMPFLPFAFTLNCRAVWRAGKWQRQACAIDMIS